MGDFYLFDHPPKRKKGQFRLRGRQTSGVQVVHTAENNTDLVLPDDGAEGVAAFISRRSTPGSYAVVFDSDSTVELMPPFTHQAFHDGTGTNRHSVGGSFACRAHQWNVLPETWVAGALEQAGRWWAAHIEAEAARGTVVPLRRVTQREARAEVPGFVSHAELDPGRRSDPGLRFPWERLFESIDTHLNPTSIALQKDDDMLESFIRASYGAHGKEPDPRGFAYWFHAAAKERPNRGWTYQDCLESEQLGLMVALLKG